MVIIYNIYIYYITYSINYLHLPLISPLTDLQDSPRPQIPELDAAILAAGGHTGPTGRCGK